MTTHILNVAMFSMVLAIRTAEILDEVVWIEISVHGFEGVALTLS